MSNPDTLSELVQLLRKESATLRDQIKLKLHLASQDAQDAWKEDVLPELSKVEQELEKAGKDLGSAADEALHESEAGLQLHLALREAETRWRAIEPHLRLLSAQTLELGKQAVGKVAEAVPEQVKLQAKLAELNARDALEARRAEAKQAWDDAREATAAEVRQRLQALRDRFAQTREKPTAG